MTEQPRPWRHVSRLRLCNMVQSASVQWEIALKAGNPQLAAQIRDELDAVNRELDSR